MNILITGGARGLGAAVVKQLAQTARNHVYFTYSNSVGAAEKLTDELPNTTSIACNFEESSSVDNLIAQFSEKQIDVLINNAYGPFIKEHFYKGDPDKFLKSFSVNVLPVIKITQAAIKEFRKVKSGKIITVLSSSVVGNPPIGWSDYVANKEYLLSMSKSWATENVKFNITSNCVSPGFMQTDFTADTDERIIDQMVQSHPLKRLLTVQEVAETIAFLTHCSPHINGINLVMNAGETIS